MNPTDLEELDRDLKRIACRYVIHDAASMLKADPLSDADGYQYMGADEVLCRPDESIATAQERYSFQQHCCCRDQGVAPDDLTLLDCIRWILRGEADEYDDDRVSVDEVLAAAGLRPELT